MKKVKVCLAGEKNTENQTTFVISWKNNRKPERVD